MKAVQLAPTKENLMVYIAMEKDMQGILPESLRNTPLTADTISHETANDSVIRRAMNYVQRKLLAQPVQRELLDPYNPLKGRICY